jgi:hypothetical protein
MSKRPIETTVALEGWTVQKIQYHRGFGYWAFLIFDLFASSSPTRADATFPARHAADITYTVRHDADGSIRKIRLRGDHSRDALATAITASKMSEHEAPR